MGGRERLQRAFETRDGARALQSFVGARVAGEDRRVVERDETRQIEHRPPTPAHVRVARDGEEPSGEIGVLVETRRVAREPEPHLLEEIVGDVGAPGEPAKEGEDARAVLFEHGIEGAPIATTQSVDERTIGPVAHASRTHENVACDKPRGAQRKRYPPRAVHLALALVQVLVNLESGGRVDEDPFTALMVFSVIPVVLPSVMAARSIVGDKRARSLEPLLARWK